MHGLQLTELDDDGKGFGAFHAGIAEADAYDDSTSGEAIN